MPVSSPPLNKVSAEGIFAEIDTVLDRHRRQVNPQFQQSISTKLPGIYQMLGSKTPPSPEVSGTLIASTVRQSFQNVGRAQATVQLQQIVADAITQSVINQKEISKGKTPEEIYEKIQEPAGEIVAANQKGLEEEAVLTDIAQIAKKPDQETQSIITDEIQSTIESQNPLMPPDQRDQIAAIAASYQEKSRENLNNELANTTPENLPSLEEFQEIKNRVHDQTVSQLETTQIGNVDIKELTSDIGAELGIKPLDPDQANRFGLGFAEPTSSTFRTQGLEGQVIAIKLASDEKAQEEAVLSLLSHDKEKVEAAQHWGHNQLFSERLNHFSRENPQKTRQYLDHFQKLRGGLNPASRTSWRTVYAYSNHYPGMYVPQSFLNQQVLTNANIGALSHQYGNFSVGNAVSGARGLSSGLKGAIGFGKGAKGAVMAGKLALGASNPAGWAMLAAQLLPFLKKHAAKIIAGALGLGMLLWLLLAKLLAKLAAIAGGAATGAVIGFVVGGPIGAVIGGLIGAGVGYLVSNFAAPVASFVGGLFSGLGSAASSVGLAINSLGSAVASGIGSAFSGSLAALGGFSNAVLSLGSISVSGGAIFAPLMIGTGAIGIGGILVGIFTGTAFFSAASGISNIVPGQNEFYTVTKTATPPHLENKPQDKTQSITFTITLTPKKIKLIDVHVSDNMTIQNKNGPITPLPQAKDKDGNNLDLSKIPCPTEIPADGSCVFNFSIPIDQTLNDSLIFNTVNVKATPEGQTLSKEDSASTEATIGTPPIPNCGPSSSFASLLKNPIPASVNPQSPASFAILDQGKVVAAAKAATAKTGVPCEILVGIHYVEAGWNDQKSFNSGRPIGQPEPDIKNSDDCVNLGGVFQVGGCVFSSLEQTALAAANIYLDKMSWFVTKGQRQPPKNFAEMIYAMSKYNGGGNSNCGAAVPYTGTCPPPTPGDDDPYAMGHFDAGHSNMYLLYCEDGGLCPKLTPFDRDGAATAAKEFYLRAKGH